MINIAQASETIIATTQTSFYEDPQFFVAVAFVITIALVGKTVYQKISIALDERSESIRRNIEDATKLREEAQDLLASYERKQRDSINEAQEISERAHAQAEILTKKATADIEKTIERRKQQAKDRIIQAEITARDEIRAAVVDLAIETSRRLLAKEVSDKKGDKLIDETIKNLKTTIH